MREESLPFGKMSVSVLSLCGGAGAGQGQWRILERGRDVGVGCLGAGLGRAAWVWAGAAGRIVGLLIHTGWRIRTSLWDWGKAGNGLFFKP